MPEQIASPQQSRIWSLFYGRPSATPAGLSLRERYARGETDRSDTAAPARGMVLAVTLGVALWMGIALLVMLAFAL
ncbi:MAG TPA: hypothetical protein VMB34_14405 [Acetobacteraceae bacterium]|nr:hypothetical protein [Acetobacteraceae bacterium]